MQTSTPSRALFPEETVEVSECGMLLSRSFAVDNRTQRERSRFWAEMGPAREIGDAAAHAQRVFDEGSRRTATE